MVLTVGKYTLSTVLHADSESVVRLATHNDSNQSFAIRMLEKNGIRRRGQSAAVKREVAAMSHLEHPNVVRLIEVMSSPTRLYLVMELVQGDDLGAFVAANGNLSPDNARDLVRAVAKALDYAHKRGVYHNALTPACVLRPKGEPWSNVKLAGFSEFAPNDPKIAVANDARALAALLALALSAKPPPLPLSVPRAAHDLFARLEHVDPAQRPNLDQVLQHPWLNGKELSMEYDDVVLSQRNRKRDEVRLSVKLPAPQSDSEDEADTFPATVPLMSTIDFLPYRSLPVDKLETGDAFRQLSNSNSPSKEGSAFDQNSVTSSPNSDSSTDEAVSAFEQINNLTRSPVTSSPKKQENHVFEQIQIPLRSPPMSPTSPRSPNEFVRRRIPRSKPVRYNASPLLSPSSKTDTPKSTSPKRKGKTRHVHSALQSPSSSETNEHFRSPQIKISSPVKIMESVILHRMPGAALEDEIKQHRADSLPMQPPKSTGLPKHDVNSASAPPQRMPVRRFSRSPAMHNLEAAPNSPSATSDDTPVSSSTISDEDESNPLTRLVRYTLPRCGTRRAKLIANALADAGVDDADDLRFVVEAKRGIKGAADWLERVTDLPALTCLRVIQAACELS